MLNLMPAVRYGAARLCAFAFVYILLEVVTWGFQMVSEFRNIDFSPFALLVGGVSLLGTTTISGLFALVPIALYLLVLPSRWHRGRLDRILTLVFFFVFSLSCIFEETAELMFWDEFTSRFNFVAVDYLVYTNEVIGNIAQSYPLVPLLSGITVLALLLTWLARRSLFGEGLPVPDWKRRAAMLLALVVVALGLNRADFVNLAEQAGNRYNAELSKDGMYSLFYAFFSNELSYRDFYLTRPDEDVLAVLRKDRLPSNGAFTGDEKSLSYTVTPDQPEKRCNVIIVLMESMGSEFFSEQRKDGQVLTPELEKLAAESLYFSQVYATGTRSVRGLEALTLSVPPLPGVSLVRYKDNGNLHSVGSIFRDKGYETKWIYGGYGYFDNMNAFFEANGFSVVDRTNLDKDEVLFSNIWGVSDEDLYRRVIREADQSRASGKPFLSVILTTSNHRPYTYPEGRIDIPSKTGRNGGVKYADFAVGQFIREARNRPWFDDTVFVFVADHGASSSGREEIKPGNHEIPLIIYSPKHIQPQRVDMPISQIDALPTLLARLNFNYTSVFYGKDALDSTYTSRYFLSNYQKLGYTRGNDTVIMRPVHEVSWHRDRQVVQPDAALQSLLDEAIAAYQHASGWRTHMRLADAPPKKPGE